MANADGNSGCWAAIGILVALPVVLALWPLIVAAGLVGLVIWGVGSYSKLMLEQDTAVWSTRHRGLVCRCRSHHGLDRKSTRLNSSHSQQSRMPSSA